MANLRWVLADAVWKDNHELLGEEIKNWSRWLSALEAGHRLSQAALVVLWWEGQQAWKVPQDSPALPAIRKLTSQIGSFVFLFLIFLYTMDIK